MLKLAVLSVLLLGLGSFGDAKIDEKTRANIHLHGVGIDEPTIDYIMAVLVNLQGIFQNGIPALNVSALDPSDIGGVHYPGLGRNYDVVTDGSADLKNLVRSGFSDVQVTDLSFEVLTLSGSLQMITPVIYVNGSYSAAGTVGGAAVTASGDLSITSTNTILNSTLSVGFNGSSLVVTEFNLLLTVGTVTVNLANLVGSQELQDALKQDIEDFLQQIDAIVATKVEALRVTLLNLLDDILGLLVPAGELTDDVPQAISALVQRIGLGMGLAHFH